jgi:hypothetical protein
MSIPFPSWLKSGPNTKVGEVYQMLAAAGASGVIPCIP